MSRCSVHDTYTEGCFRCKLVSIQFAGTDELTERRIENQQERDLPAYQRLRANGIQPRSTKGCAELETRAHSQLEVELGGLIEPQLLRRHQGEIAEGMQMAREHGYGTADVSQWKKDRAGAATA